MGVYPFLSSCQFKIMTRLFNLAVVSNAVLMFGWKGVSRIALTQSPLMDTSRQFGSEFRTATHSEM